MCYTRRKIQGGVGALRESDDTNFLEPNGQSRNLNVYESQLEAIALRSVLHNVKIAVFLKQQQQL